jgi:hypothetical protein
MKVILVLATLLTFLSAHGKALYPIAEMALCDQESQHEKVSLRDFKHKPFLVQWSQAAPASCPGKGFPRIVLRHEEVDAYVHIVESNTESPPHLKNEPSWNPLQQSSPWIFLDLSEESRKAKVPFYSEGHVFHDNPQWEAQELHWQGFLYGLKKSKDGTYRPLLGFRWGFKIEAGKIKALRPSALSLESWREKRRILAAVLRAWGTRKFHFEEHSVP